MYTPKVGTKAPRPFPSVIQLWSFSMKEGKKITHCEALLCIESGHANELKWCPLPSHDPVGCIFCEPQPFAENLQLGTEHDLDKPRKLGLLAGTFEDGSFSVFVVPHPNDLRLSNVRGPIYGEEWDFILFPVLRRRNPKSSQDRADPPHRTARYKLLGLRLGKQRGGCYRVHKR